MNSQTIWEEIYDVGLRNRTSLDTMEKKHLFYFIDLIYQIELGGFIYNQSPSSKNDNNYLPYIESLIYFKRERLADEITNYNKLYQKSFSKWSLEKRLNFNDFLEKQGVNQLEERIENLLYSLQENHDDIFDWIDQNRNKFS